MSILNKLKAAKDAKELKLHDAHPLAQESHDSRLRYLSAVAWALGLDREPLSIEQEAFVALADSLSVDAGDARELIAERANVTEGDMATMLEMAKSQKYVYLLDVCWMLVMDGKVGASVREFLVEGVVRMVEVEKKVGSDLLAFALARRNKDFPALFKLQGRLLSLNFDSVSELLKEVMAFTNEKTKDLYYCAKKELFPMDGVWSVNVGDFVNAGDELLALKEGNLATEQGWPTRFSPPTKSLCSPHNGFVVCQESLARSSIKKWGVNSWDHNCADELFFLGTIYVTEK